MWSLSLQYIMHMVHALLCLTVVVSCQPHPSFGVTSQVLGQSYHCTESSKATQKGTGKQIHINSLKLNDAYRQTSDIRHTESLNLNVSRLVL